MTTPSASRVTPPESDTADDWAGELDVNPYGVRLLTLPRAFELASSGGCAGWYVSPFALQWTVGRMTSSGRRFHVISDGEPLCFESVGEALQFLGGTLKVAAAPQVALDWSRVSVGSAASPAAPRNASRPVFRPRF